MFSFRYPNLETFAVDVRLVFDNCETFNEDDSDIGRAGHSMRKYFEKKWTDIFKVSWSYNNLSFFFLLNKDKWDQQCELYLHKCARHIHNDFFFLKISITKKQKKKSIRRMIPFLKASLLQQPRPLVIGLCDLSANLGRTGKHTQRIFKGKGVIVQ